MKKYEQITLQQTCDSCPEQYDAFFKNDYIAHLRLRHGHFTVTDISGRIIYHAYPQGDGLFHANERCKYLKKAKKAIWKDLKKKRKI